MYLYQNGGKPAVMKVWLVTNELFENREIHQNDQRFLHNNDTASMLILLGTTHIANAFLHNLRRASSPSLFDLKVLVKGGGSLPSNT